MTGLIAGDQPARKGQALFEHVHPDDVAALSRAIAEAPRHRERRDIRFRLIRPDDRREIRLAGGAVALRNARGIRIGTMAAVRDVSAEAEEADRRAGEVAELDHRMKNVFAAVQSLAAQSARRSPSLEAFLKVFSGRLDALAAAHGLLAGTHGPGADVGRIAAAALGGLALGQARWSGPDIRLTPRAAHALTLALHELSANAVRHGALSRRTGRVDVEWRSTGSGGFEIVWSEAGGPSVAAPTRRGFGSTLIERVTGRELGGAVSLDFRPEGLRAVMTGDASARADPAAAPADGWQGAPEASASRGEVGDADIRGLRILIVEDSTLLSLELESALTESGAQVVGSAADVAEAMRLQALDFDVAVLDANLNGQSVRPVATAMAARGRPFIFATGYGEAGAAPAGFSAPVVRKPYNIRQISAALSRALDGG